MSAKFKNQQYTITQARQFYTPARILSTAPDFCDRTVSFVIPSDLTGYLELDAATTLFEIYIDDSTILAGPISTVYTITNNIVVRDFDGVQTGSDTATFSWTVNNPCLDNDYVFWDNTIPPFVPEDDYSGTPFTVVPANAFGVVAPLDALCPISVECRRVRPRTRGFLGCSDVEIAD